MKLHFRMTLLLTLLGLVITTVATIGIASYLSARSAARDLASQILTQTSMRVDQQVEKLMDEAFNECALTAELQKSEQLKSRDFPQMVHYWRDVMKVTPGLASVFECIDETGDTVGVSRLKSGQLSVWQSTRNTSTGGFEVREFNVDEYPGAPSRIDFKPGTDIRTRPWFVSAKTAGHAVWTNTYVFLGLAGVDKVQGVTYAVPVYKTGGKLDSVVTADYDLHGISQFLKGLQVGETGFSFLVEYRDDGTLRVIAHPDPKILMGKAHPEADIDLLPVDMIADERVNGFMKQLPPGGLQVTNAGGNVHFTVGGENFLGRFSGLEGDHMPHWLICTVLPENDILAHAKETTHLTMLVTLAALILAIAAGMVVSRQVARPLEQLAFDAAAVGHLRLNQRPVIRSFVVEVNRLAMASEEMKVGLRSFQKYVSADLVRSLVDSGQEAKLGGERRPLSIYFSDIADFTTIAESMPSEELVLHLGEYLGVLNEQILSRGGTVDKYIGDAIMAFWGAPQANPLHAAAACDAALSCQKRLEELRGGWRAKGHPEFHTRIGIHTGEAVVGNIGSAARMSYTVIGDTVNLASRLEGLNKYYGTSILISEVTYKEAGADFIARPLDRVSVKGRSQAIEIYELVGRRSDVGPAELEIVKLYAVALESYRSRNWSETLTQLAAILALKPNDGPSLTLLARCTHYKDDDPGERWDGVYRLDKK